MYQFASVESDDDVEFFEDFFADVVVGGFAYMHVLYDAHLLGLKYREYYNQINDKDYD